MPSLGNVRRWLLAATLCALTAAGFAAWSAVRSNDTAPSAPATVTQTRTATVTGTPPTRTVRPRVTPPVVVEPTVRIQQPTRVMTAHATRTVVRTTAPPRRRTTPPRRSTSPTPVRLPSVVCGVLPLPGLC